MKDSNFQVEFSDYKSTCPLRADVSNARDRLKFKRKCRAESPELFKAYCSDAIPKKLLPKAVKKYGDYFHVSEFVSISMW